jgi:hypothetical protein
MGWWRMHPQDSARSLAPHPHRFTLRGAPSDWAFPPLCPNCGLPATRRLTREKVFRRLHSESPSSFVTASVEVPFCDACIARHEAYTPPVARWRLVLRSFATTQMLGVVYPAIGAAFCAWLALGEMVDGRVDRALIQLALAAAFGGIAWFQRRRIWLRTAYLRASPQSEVARAFDFSDDVSPAFESARCVCTIRDARFAAEFIALNRVREWVPGSTAARRERQQADRKGWIAGAVVVALLLASMIDDWLG